ncbi:MAG: nucleotide sugar dehydrogenase [Steroidobacteraceae bacterium]
MRISVFGLGYVGAVSAACLASDGHEVVGVDKNAAKVDLINAGRSPIIETGIDQLITSGHAAGRLLATTDAAEAIRRSDVSLVCVGTPSEANGSLNLGYVRNVCAEIGAALARKDRPHDVVIRSTILPGAMRSLVIPTLEESAGKKIGGDIRVCFNPEFLREGTAVHDYYHPSKTVIGESEAGAGERLLELYAKLEAPVTCTSLEIAEMVKYVDNTWHALKVGFANEIGSLAKALGIDSFEVMRIFCQDTKLNLSAYYLRPGFAFGGSCLPKDVRALRYRAKTLDVEAPILSSILASNDAHIQRGLDLVLAQGKRRVGVLGFSFKAGTDDLRESPIVELIERLIGKGYELLVYDRSVNLARLTGANREYILNHVPHIANLMRESMDEVLAHAEVVVIGNASAEFDELASRLRPEQRVIDLVRIEDTRRAAGRGANGQYHGICW